MELHILYVQALCVIIQFFMFGGHVLNRTLEFKIYTFLISRECRCTEVSVTHTQFPPMPCDFT
jgi:hypothetical protein